MTTSVTKPIGSNQAGSVSSGQNNQATDSSRLGKLDATPTNSSDVSTIISKTELSHSGQVRTSQSSQRLPNGNPDQVHIVKSTLKGQKVEIDLGHLLNPGTGNKQDPGKQDKKGTYPSSTSVISDLNDYDSVTSHDDGDSEDEITGSNTGDTPTVRTHATLRTKIAKQFCNISTITPVKVQYNQKEKGYDILKLDIQGQPITIYGGRRHTETTVDYEKNTKIAAKELQHALDTAAKKSGKTVFAFNMPIKIDKNDQHTYLDHTSTLEINAKDGKIASITIHEPNIARNTESLLELCKTIQNPPLDVKVIPFQYRLAVPSIATIIEKANNSHEFEGTITIKDRNCIAVSLAIAAHLEKGTLDQFITESNEIMKTNTGSDTKQVKELKKAAKEDPKAFTLGIQGFNDSLGSTFPGNTH